MCSAIASPKIILLFFFNDTATTEIYTLSLHDALPISRSRPRRAHRQVLPVADVRLPRRDYAGRGSRTSATGSTDRKSTRLNSSHDQISYAVFCLKKKKKRTPDRPATPRRSPAESAAAH